MKYIFLTTSYVLHLNHQLHIHLQVLTDSWLASVVGKALNTSKNDQRQSQAILNEKKIEIGDEKTGTIQSEHLENSW